MQSYAPTRVDAVVGTLLSHWRISVKSPPTHHTSPTVKMMEWTQDYCLACDRQISQPGNGAYCTQSCRLADLEKASNSSASSSPQAAAASSWSAAPTIPSSSAFYLPPPVNFSQLSASAAAHASTPPTFSGAYSGLSTSPPAPQHAYSYSYSGASSTAAARQPSLYSSPSRTSLNSSAAPTQDPSLLSDKVRADLQNYASSFDHVRDWKRRLTVA